MTASNGLVWEDPPSQRSTQFDWASILASLRQKPQSWARVRVYADRSGAQTAVGQQRGRLPAGYELRQSSAGMKGKSALYARYVGEGDEA